MLGDLDVREGAGASDGAIRSAVDWMDVENKQDVPEAGKRDLQEIIAQHIKSNIGYCADDEFEDAGEEHGAKSEAPRGFCLLLDALGEHLIIISSSQAQYHVYRIREMVPGPLEEHFSQPGETAMVEVMD